MLEGHINSQCGLSSANDLLWLHNLAQPAEAIRQHQLSANALFLPCWALPSGDAAVNREAAKKQQLKMLKEAEQTCQAAAAQVERSTSCSTANTGNSSDAKSGMSGELAALAANIPKLRKLVENKEVKRQKLTNCSSQTAG